MVCVSFLPTTIRTRCGFYFTGELMSQSLFELGIFHRAVTFICVSA